MPEWGTARWLAPVLVVVVSLAVAGGLLARDLYQREEPDRAAAEVPAASALKPSEQPGPREVKLTPDAANHPYGDTVSSLLQSYIDGINGRNYDRWKTAVTVERVRKQPERQWLQDFRSTRNGSVLVHRIESTPNGTLRVLVSFTSTQDRDDAPDTLKETCIRWQLAWPLAQERGQWKIAPVPQGTGAVQVYRKC